MNIIKAFFVQTILIISIISSQSLCMQRTRETEILKQRSCMQETKPEKLIFIIKNFFNFTLYHPDETMGRIIELCDQGANPIQPNDHGIVPLSLAASYNRIEPFTFFVKILKERGLDARVLVLSSRDKWRKTPFEWAVLNCCEEVTKFILWRFTPEIEELQRAINMAGECLRNRVPETAHLNERINNFKTMLDEEIRKRSQPIPTMRVALPVKDPTNNNLFTIISLPNNTLIERQAYSVDGVPHYLHDGLLIPLKFPATVHNERGQSFLLREQAPAQDLLSI